jgi:CBS domain-containing protein
MKVDALMTSDVLTVSPEASLKEAARLLADRGISGLPVVDSAGSVVGVLSEADIVAKARGAMPRSRLLGWLLEGEAKADDRLTAVTVADAMSAPAVTIGSRRPVHEAAARLIAKGVNRLPVVDSGRLVGIVTRADLVRAFTRSDSEIETEIREDVLRRTLWLEPGHVSLSVVDGQVSLEGEVASETDAELLRLFVERVPGVVSVDSRVHARSKAALQR